MQSEKWKGQSAKREWGEDDVEGARELEWVDREGVAKLELRNEGKAALCSEGRPELRNEGNCRGSRVQVVMARSDVAVGATWVTSIGGVGERAQVMQREVVAGIVVDWTSS